jgi:hypothetical protein
VIKFRNGIFGFALSLCAISAASGLSSSEVFGKSGGGDHAPSAVHSPSTPATVTKKPLGAAGELLQEVSYKPGVPSPQSDPADLQGPASRPERHYDSV